MEPEQKSMFERIGSFMQQVAGLDYRIAVTTTDSHREFALEIEHTHFVSLRVVRVVHHHKLLSIADQL